MNNYNLLGCYATLRVILEKTKSPYHCIDQLSIPILLERKGDIIENEYLCNRLYEKHALSIPLEIASNILIRMTDNRAIRRVGGAFVVADALKDNGIDELIETIKTGITETIRVFIDYSMFEHSLVLSQEQASELLVKFFSACVMGENAIKSAMYSRVVVDLIGNDNKNIVILLAGFLSYIQSERRELSKSLLHLYQGSLIAGATIYSDFDIDRAKAFKGNIFYLDAPMLIDFLGLSGNTRKRSAEEMLDLVTRLGGRFACFSHNLVEMHNIIRASANNLDNPDWFGNVVETARSRGNSTEWLLGEDSTAELRLKKSGIDVINSPKYSDKHDFQIDEVDLKSVLDAEISYSGKNACDFDVKSIRAIYAIRADTQPRNLEGCNAIFVTANLALVRVAAKWGRIKESSLAIPTAISNYSLVNRAWLKAPNASPNATLPTMCSIAYASLQPTADFLQEIRKQLDSLKDNGDITEAEFQMYKSDYRFIRCATLTTLGNSAALDKVTIPKIIHKYQEENNAKLLSREKRILRISKKIDNFSNILSYIIPAVLFCIILGGIFLTNLYEAHPMTGIIVGSLYVLYTFVDLFFDWNIPSLRDTVRKTIALLLNKMIGNIEDESD